MASKISLPATLIIEYLKKTDSDQVKLAAMFGITPQAMGKKLKRENISYKTIEEISDKLQHDFFHDLSEYWQRKHFSVERVVMEPGAKYGKPTTFDEYLRLLVQDEVKKIVKR